MPRLLPRIVQAALKPPKPPKSSLRPWPVRKDKSDGTVKATSPADYCPNRTKSILLDPVNPILHRDAYDVPKRTQPRKHIPRDAEQSSSPVEKLLHEQHVKQSTNPYLKMLASPMRKCALTDVHLPSDFLLRLSTSEIKPRDDPREKSDIYLLPDGLEHSQFRDKTSGRASYVLCWREAVNEFIEKGRFKRVHTTAKAHSLFQVQVDHLLRLRVLQELEILLDRVEKLSLHPHDATDSPVLRKLTKSEWETFQSGSTVSGDPHAIAVLVFPLSSPSQPPSEVLSDRDGSTFSSTSAYPLSRLDVQPLMSTSDSLPLRRIPIYFGTSLFPNIDQRAAARQYLENLLNRDLERIAKWHSRIRQVKKDLEAPQTPSPSEPSATITSSLQCSTQMADAGDHITHEDVYLIRSDALTLRRADTTPLAIACWRVRLWEGDGWKGSLN